MQRLLHSLASLSDSMMKAEAMKWLRPIFSPLSLPALTRAIEEDINILAHAWASLPQKEQDQARDDAAPWAVAIRSIGEKQVLRWLEEEFPEHVALIRGQAKGILWVRMLLTSMRGNLLRG